MPFPVRDQGYAYEPVKVAKTTRGKNRTFVVKGRLFFMTSTCCAWRPVGSAKPSGWPGPFKGTCTVAVAVRGPRRGRWWADVMDARRKPQHASPPGYSFPQPRGNCRALQKSERHTTITCWIFLGAKHTPVSALVCETFSCLFETSEVLDLVLEG